MAGGISLGNVFDPTRANSNGFSEGTTPVGQFSPRGDSPYGCADMAGNVWNGPIRFTNPTRIGRTMAAKTKPLLGFRVVVVKSEL